ncbi:MAG: hypothetical protein IPL99_03945 [Candidatus Competibacteraceae bacterium]|nr:hypothetical protein [Candidatus Competibacteraceae bacterium]
MLGWDAVAQLDDPAQWAALPGRLNKTGDCANQGNRAPARFACREWCCGCLTVARPIRLKRLHLRNADEPIPGRIMGQSGVVSPGAVLDVEDLPMHIYEEAGERVMQPVTEVLLGERAMSAILARGIMPLLGQRQRNAVRLARFQSLADPPVALAGHVVNRRDSSWQ